MIGWDLGDGVALRVPELADADELYGVVAANRAHLAPWMPWAAGQDLGGTRVFLHTNLKQLADNLGFNVAVVVDGRIGGMAGFHAIDWTNRRTAVGYWLAGDLVGRGIMTRAVATLVEHAFEEYALHRLEIRAAPENLRSRRVAERCGFTEEGTLREVERLGDRYLDHVVYGLLRPERAAQTGP